MALHVSNKRAEELTREFARIEGVSLAEAIIIAMSEAIERRMQVEPVRDTASKTVREPLPKSGRDDM